MSTKTPEQRRLASLRQQRYAARKKAEDAEAWAAMRLTAIRQDRERHPEEVRARRFVARAVKRGQLVKPDCCARCGQSGSIEASHDDYSKPLEVEWLCSTCHGLKDYPLTP